MSESTENQTGITEDAFDFMDWLQSGTIARRQVVIYNDPAALEEYQSISAALVEAGWTDDDSAQEPAEGPLGGTAQDEQIDALLTQRDAALVRLEASRATWTVRAVSIEEVEATFDAIPTPKQPVPPKDNAPQPLQDRFMEKVREYQLARGKADEDRKLALLAVAVVGVETPRGAADGVTFDQLAAMRKRPHGQQWIERLYDAANAASSEDVAPPVPTSSGRSTNSLA